jgi:putative tryptophan/tyrosine transport system substrate-binding protein
MSSAIAPSPADLVSLAPDAVLALGYATVSALQRATRSVPIVFVDVIDPVGGSLVASLVRLGGNTTGVSILASELDVKRLEILHEFIPQARRIAMLIDTTTISTRAELSCAGGTRPCARAGYATRRPQVCGVSSSAMVAAWTSSLVPVTP